jgi:hypothetical protein
MHEKVCGVTLKIRGVISGYGWIFTGVSRHDVLH